MISTKIVYLGISDRPAQWLLLVFRGEFVIGVDRLRTKPTKRYTRQFIKVCK